MSRIISILVILGIFTAAVAVGFATSWLFQASLLASAGFGLGTAIIGLQLRLLMQQRKINEQIELDFAELSGEIEVIRTKSQSVEQRVQVSEVRVDQFAEKLQSLNDPQARGDIAELGSLVTRMIDTISVIDRQTQMHRQVLFGDRTKTAKTAPPAPNTTPPVASPNLSAPPVSTPAPEALSTPPPSSIDPTPAEAHQSQAVSSTPSTQQPAPAPSHAAPNVPQMAAPETAPPPDMRVPTGTHLEAPAATPATVEAPPATNPARTQLLAALRTALSRHEISVHEQAVHELPYRKLAANISWGEMQVNREDGTAAPQSELRKLAAEDGLLACIDLLTLNQICRRLQTHPPANSMIIPLSTQSLIDLRFADALEETLEAHRDHSTSLVLEFPAKIVSLRFTEALAPDQLLALNTRLKRYRRWGYAFGLQTRDDLGTRLPLGQLAELGFQFIRVPAAPLLDAANAVASGQKIQLDIHPEDYAQLMTKNGLKLIVDGLDTEGHVLQIQELGATLGVGAALNDAGWTGQMRRVS